ncbi:MAG: branched-chain-amino-acid transaminase [Epulopiscium sp. Nele67-Bin004]|nr:MAG: branched-chain-amino-acid transaminase [Epulopiscium sp. Nele67-Bin004]
MSECIYVDGKFCSEENAKVSVFDHGYLYGDGVFEGIRFYNSRIFRFDKHMKRLYDSAKAILLTIPVDVNEFKEIIKESVRKSGFTDGYLRVIVSRGMGDLGLDPRKCPKPTIVVIPAKLKLYPQEAYDNGMSIITVPTRRSPSEVLNPRIKSLNYLNNILAKIEASNVGYDEAIMLNQDGGVAECTADNIFFIKDKVIYTPAISNGALKGITRDFVCEIAQKAGYEIKETNVSRYDIYTADELFITGTACEIMPVVKADGRSIGAEGKVGDITKQLLAKFTELVTVEGEPV